MLASSSSSSSRALKNRSRGGGWYLLQPTVPSRGLDLIPYESSPTIDCPQRFLRSRPCRSAFCPKTRRRRRLRWRCWRTSWRFSAGTVPRTFPGTGSEGSLLECTPQQVCCCSLLLGAPVKRCPAKAPDMNDVKKYGDIYPKVGTRFVPLTGLESVPKSWGARCLMDFLVFASAHG